MKACCVLKYRFALANNKKTSLSAEFLYPTTITAAKSVKKLRRHLSSMSSNASGPDHSEGQVSDSDFS